jgi:serine/threonine protein kinase
MEDLSQGGTVLLEAKKTLGRYRILGELGRGAMGAVYRAVDPLIEREVAIKTLLPNLPEELMVEVRERFLREARSAGRLNHPNIVTIFDVGEQDGVAYIAMELLDGDSLLQILREPQRIAFDAVADIAAQVADALDHAQHFKIVHRDIKPANVMVSSSGRCKLTDFGVAFVPTSTMTQAGTALGSPRYMSPEQVTGVPVDGRSDIFSLGTVLYEMLVRSNPFERQGDTTPFPVMHRIAGAVHVPVRDLDPKIPPEFDRILARALAKKPQDRYQRASEMAHDLRRLTSAPPATESPADKTIPGSLRSIDVTQTDVRSQLLDDLDDFVKRFEAEEQALIKAAQAEQLQKEQALQAWGAAEEKKRQIFQATLDGVPAEELAGGPPATRRSGALEALRKQAEGKPRVEDRSAERAKAASDFDHDLRAAFQYFAEFGKEVNSVNPSTGRAYEFLYVGKMPSVRLSDAWVDKRTKQIDGKAFCELILVRYKIHPEPPAKTTLLGADIPRGDEYLKSLRADFDVRIVAKTDFGQPSRALFTVRGKLPCDIDMRADYDKREVVVELTNVRHLGRRECRIPAKNFKDVVDDLARYMLGVDDDFEKVLRK